MPSLPSSRLPQSPALVQLHVSKCKSPNRRARMDPSGRRGHPASSGETKGTPTKPNRPPSGILPGDNLWGGGDDVTLTRGGMRGKWLSGADDTYSAREPWRRSGVRRCNGSACHIGEITPRPDRHDAAIRAAMPHTE